jgi:two-component system sensor histidine kinase KdpD
LTARGVVGVLGVKPDDSEKYLTQEQRQLLESYAGLAALAIERSQLEEQSKQAQLSTATEKLQSALLNSISHDLRTPLATITGSFSSLFEAETAKKGTVKLSKKDRLELIENGMQESTRLNRLVGNLLDMSRIESGSFKLLKQLGDFQEVIGSALARFSENFLEHPVRTDIEPGLPLVSMDVMLIEQVMVNLLDNAMKYSISGTPIDIRVYYAGGEIKTSIADIGAGIPPADLERIFDKFYRVHHPDEISGTGLGLSICKGIIEAHGGKIWAMNHPKGGAILTFTLPLQEQRSPVGDTKNARG